MKKTFRTADEEMKGVFFAVLVAAIWYGQLLRNIGISGMTSSYLIFLSAGILPLAGAAYSIRRALFYRRKRRQAVATSRPVRGRIVNVLRRDAFAERGRNRRVRLYYLVVEITDPVTGGVTQFESDAYSRPVHRKLASPWVDVYTDSGGWKHYLEGFEVTGSPGEQGIFGEATEFEETLGGQGFSRVFLVIFIVFLIWTFLEMFR